MITAKLKTLVSFLPVAALALGGAGRLAYQAHAAGEAEKPPVPAAAAPADKGPRPSKLDLTPETFTALGDYTGGCCACDYGKVKEDGHFVAKEPLPIAMSFEIDNNNYELPAEYRRSTPYLIWRFRNQTPFYFDPDKWEADWRKRNKK
jgi:hypothetical protein